MVFNATFNNISVISWQSVLLVEEITDLSQVTDKLYHIMLYTSSWLRFELTTLVVIGTDCIGSCKSNYYTITATTTPPPPKKFKTMDFKVSNYVLYSNFKYMLVSINIVEIQGHIRNIAPNYLLELSIKLQFMKTFKIIYNAWRYTMVQDYFFCKYQ
jgi:hypothetical protein